MGKIDYNSKKSILDLSFQEAKSFLLNPERFCSIDFPSYISFEKIIKEVDSILSKKELNSLSGKPENYENVNYIIINNKDGKYAWRPLQIIHPALYVSLVHNITKEENWNFILKKFTDFQQNAHIQCFSLPVVALSGKKDKAEQILHWWRSIEQRSIELSLEYEYLLETDISDCYGSIYTHTIPWALHTRDEAKKPENKHMSSLLGNVIDKHIQSMQYGQTNGIPQGSVLMDFIAEIILCYADCELSKKLEVSKISDEYHILRYRDDYRVFVNNSQLGERILKIISEVVTDLGMKLSPQKTKINYNIVESSIKDDKLSWIFLGKYNKSLQKTLLIIHTHARRFPNSGSVSRALDEFRRRLGRYNIISDSPLVLIAIVVDIACENPRTYVVCSAIISKLLTFVSSEQECVKIVEKIKNKIYKKPNTGYMQIWLQRISWKYSNTIDYEDALCKVVSGNNNQIWNNDWITSEKLKKAVDATKIIDYQKLNSMSEVVSSKEIEVFTSTCIERYG